MEVFTITSSTPENFGINYLDVARGPGRTARKSVDDDLIDTVKEVKTPAQAKPPEKTGAQAEQSKSTDRPAAGTEAPRDPMKSLRQAEALEARMQKEAEAGDLKQMQETMKQVIEKYDGALTEKEMIDSVPALSMRLQILKEGRETVVQDDGSLAFTDQPLSPERRVAFHADVIRVMGVVHDQIRTRHELARMLWRDGKYADAEKYALEATRKADLLLKPVEFQGRQIRMIDLLNKEAKQAVEDMTKFNGQQDIVELLEKVNFQITGGVNSNSGTKNYPINTQKFLSMLYLGSKVIDQETIFGTPTGQSDIKFGMTSAFKPQQAFEAAEKARAYAKEIYGYDPLSPDAPKTDSAMTFLFGGMMEVISKPQRYELFRDKDGDGKPDLIDNHTARSIEDKIRKMSKFDSRALDLAILGTTIATLAGSRSGKAAGIFEKMGFGAHSAKAARVSGMTLAIGGSIPARHFGYEMLTGQKESLGDSLLHVGGTLLTAELTSRTMGHGSVFNPAVKGNGATAYTKFDVEESARLFNRSGMENTGKLSEHLMAKGFVKEAQIVGKYAPETLITSEKGLLALQEARLTHNRLATVADTMVANPGKGISGFLKHHASRTVSNLSGSSRHMFKPIEPSTATARTLADARWAGSFKGTAVGAAIYNSTAETTDKTHEVNPATGDYYTYLEALQQVHWPASQEDANLPLWQKSVFSALGGTPGQVLFAPLFLEAGAIGRPIWSNPNAGLIGKSLSTINPLPWRKLSNLNSFLFSSPRLAPLGIMTGIEMPGLLGDLDSKIWFPDQPGQWLSFPTATERQKLENINTPIQNGK